MTEIPGYPGYYATEDGKIFSTAYGYARELTPSKHKKRGYLRVCVRVGGQTKTPWHHTLVLLAFRGPRPEGMECRHLDGCRHNNAIANLEWGTKEENTNDKRLHGTVAKGVSCRNAKLTDDLVREIKERLGRGETQASVARAYGVGAHAIKRIRTGVGWSHVGV